MCRKLFSLRTASCSPLCEARLRRCRLCHLILNVHWDAGKVAAWGLHKRIPEKTFGKSRHAVWLNSCFKAVNTGTMDGNQKVLSNTFLTCRERDPNLVLIILNWELSSLTTTLWNSGKLFQDEGFGFIDNYNVQSLLKECSTCLNNSLPIFPMMSRNETL
jgi:hypothetical protein